MLVTILARMSTDEQRVQLLHRLRNKLANYNLNWLDIRMIISCFDKNEQIRFEICQFLLFYVKNLSKKMMEIEDYIDLSNQCTDGNEQNKIRLFEQICNKLNIRNQDDLERIYNLFPTVWMKQKVKAMIRVHIHSEIPDEQFSVSQFDSSRLQSTKAKNLLPPMGASFAEQISIAPLKRRYSFDEKYDQDQTCQQILTPASLIEQDEFIAQQDTLLSISVNSSSDSSLSSASNETIPIRTRSFMIAIRKTFERLKETSS